MAWISITTKLPPLKESVLVFTEDGQMIVGYNYWGQNKNDWVDSRWSYTLPNVTHWMLLPDKPKDK